MTLNYKRIIKKFSVFLFDKLKIYKFIDYLDLIRWECKYNYYRKIYNIDPTFRFNGIGIILYGDGKIICGANSYIGRYSSIQAHKGCKVEIGKNCSLSHFIMIYTYNALADQDFSRNNKKKVVGDVIIKDHCWIGAKTFIRENVIIGENSVIGAGSVVVKSIPPHSIAVGVPAKVVKFKSYLTKNEVLRLAEKYKNVLSDKLKKYLEI